jgi:hypothetical protein
MHLPQIVKYSALTAADGSRNLRRPTSVAHGGASVAPAMVNPTA